MSNTKTLMIASALFMGLLGIMFSFLPDQILYALHQIQNPTLILFTQIFGALYFGFGIMNWMGKTVLIGGIYSRPLCIGNFTHFTIASIAMIKAIITGSITYKYFMVITIIYIIFSILFGYILFSNPKSLNGAMKGSAFSFLPACD